MAFVIPVKRKIGKQLFTRELQLIVNSLNKTEQPGMFLSNKQLDAIDRTRCLVDNVQPYLQVLERRLHGFVAFFIMPVFALANAGVQFSTGNGLEINSVAWNVGIALMFGKVIGITLFSYLAVRFKIARFPKNVDIRHIFGVSFLGAVGFTMSLFINSLAYSEDIFINSAKFGIIGASVIAGIFGYLILKKTLK
jgi:NhaA family Na+:H+ antiporter